MRLQVVPNGSWSVKEAFGVKDPTVVNLDPLDSSVLWTLWTGWDGTWIGSQSVEARGDPSEGTKGKRRWWRLGVQSDPLADDEGPMRPSRTGIGTFFNLWTVYSSWGFHSREGEGSLPSGTKGGTEVGTDNH